MKFELKKSVLASLFKKASTISTKAIKADYDLANRVSFIAEKDRLIVTATNGHLDYRAILTVPESGLKIVDQGTVIVNSTAALPIATTIGGSNQDAVIEVYDEDKKGSKAIVFNNRSAKHKERASVETFQKGKDIEIHKPKNPMYSVELDLPDGIRWLKAVLPYAQKQGFFDKYKVACIHSRKDKGLHFVAGEKARFAVIKTPIACDIDAKMVFPADQMQLVLKVMEGNQKMFLSWKDKQSCYIAGGYDELFCHGIPDVEYINYDIHAFREPEAKYVVDVAMSDLSQAVLLAGAVKDDEWEEMSGGFHSATIEGSCKSQTGTFYVEERRKSEYTMDMPSWKMNASDPDDFKGSYCHLYLVETAKLSCEYMRLFFLDQIVIARPVSLTEAKDGKGMPVIAETPDKSEFRIFFASTREKAE